MKLDWLSPVCTGKLPSIFAFLEVAGTPQIMGMTDYNDSGVSALQDTLIQQNVNRHFSSLGWVQRSWWYWQNTEVSCDAVSVLSSKHLHNVQKAIERVILWVLDSSASLRFCNIMGGVCNPSLWERRWQNCCLSSHSSPQRQEEDGEADRQKEDKTTYHQWCTSQPQSNCGAATTLGSHSCPVILVELEQLAFLHAVIDSVCPPLCMIMQQPLCVVQRHKVERRVRWAMNNLHPIQPCTSPSQLFQADVNWEI